MSQGNYDGLGKIRTIEMEKSSENLKFKAFKVIDHKEL